MKLTKKKLNITFISFFIILFAIASVLSYKDFANGMYNQGWWGLLNVCAVILILIRRFVYYKIDKKMPVGEFWIFIVIAAAFFTIQMILANI